METGLDPINSPVKDEAAMNVLRLESRVVAVVNYLARLKVATSRIDTALWPGETLQNNLESLMTRLNEVPSRVQEWNKSSARTRERTSWRLSKWPIPRSMTFDLSWRPSLLLPLGSQMESTRTSSLRLIVLRRSSKKNFYA